MIFHILTIFPNLVEFYFKDSLLKKALKRRIIKIKIWNIRDFTKDKHHSVDDKPYGGGPGMLMKIEPIFNCLEHIFKKCFYKRLDKLRDDGKLIILTSAKGKLFNQKMAVSLGNFKEIAIICGRYEGTDERVKKYLIHEEISIGKFILSGGEIAALAIIETISRLIPGVLGNIKSLQEESYNCKNLVEYPQYTRPAIFKPAKNIEWAIPKILKSGNHQKINEWKQKLKK